MPIISVIVPVYKVEPYLRRCVDSILAQTYRDFELILVDDGSPDNCGAICDEYAQRDQRVIVIHQNNGGISAARNAGIDWVFANSDSQWISFVDSDDWIHAEMLEQLLQVNLELGTDISMCEHQQTDGTVCNSDFTAKAPLLYTPEQLFDRYTWITVYVWGKLYRRSCFEQLRFPLGKVYEDVFLQHHIMFSHKQIAMLWVPYYFYFRANPDSITKNKWTKQRLDFFDALEDRFFFFNERGYRNLAKKCIKEYVLLSFRQLYQISLLGDRNERRTYRKLVYRRMIWGLKCCIKERVFPTFPLSDCILWIKKHLHIHQS